VSTRKGESIHGLVPLLTLPEAAELLNVSTRTVRRQIDDGLLPTVRIGGAVRIRPDDLRSFIGKMTRSER
jgi:excisionase family DNA binding protein